MNEKKYEQKTPYGIISYSIIKSSRKSYCIQVSAGGIVTVRMPLKGSEQFVAQLVTERAEWIRNNIEKLKNVPQKIEKKEKSDYEKRLEAPYRKAAKSYIPKRVAYYAPRIGVTYGSISIKDQKTRWGSCSSKGNLNFNFRLMLAPPKVIDYVVVHELCHRLEMNHSATFWNHVARIMPDYKEQKKWLKEHGSELQP